MPPSSIPDKFSDQLTLFLNNASRSPLPLSHRKILSDYTYKWEQGQHDPYHVNFNQSDELRTEVSRFVHCETDQISIQTNVAQSFSIILHGLDWNDDDEVILIEQDYPSVTLPFEAHLSINTKWVTPINGLVQTKDIQSLINVKTRAIALSWVNYSTGQVNDIQEISKLCKQHNILLLVDATQALGVIPINLINTPVDFFVASLYKWCFCPQGMALGIFSNELMMQLTPLSSGVFSQYNRTIRYRPNEPSFTARKFEFGNLNILGIMLALETFRWFNLIGILSLNTILSNLSQKILNLIHRKPYKTTVEYSHEHFSSIISFYHPKRDSFMKQLRLHGGSATFRDNYIRLSPGIYQTESTIDAIDIIL